jgi:ABC-type bacteriocin/lantibiotic exporter with double-glycine peptidase domain
LSEFIDTLPMKLETHVEENGLTLSGGQRQRLVLARALYREPALLLLDEVTNQLDDDTKTKVLTNLKALSQQGMTIIVASHDQAIKNYADQIVRLT